MSSAVVSADELHAMVADVLDVDPRLLKPRTRLRTDLGVDSIGMLRVVCEIEERYSIELDLEEIELLDTLESAHRYVASLVAAELEQQCGSS